MQTWSITLHGPAGVISTVDTGESQFVVGTETASDVFTVHGDGVAQRHAWVWISEAGLEVEDLGAGTLVNGYQITERVQVEYPASVQVGELTLVIEVKAVQPAAVFPTPSSMDITIPQRAVTKSKASLEVTIPQRTPTRSNVQRAASTGTPSAQPASADKASTLCEYTLVKEIARGGMGQIYFGEDPQLKRNVAVKISSVSEAGEDPRFSKEAEVLAQLAHPNIVPIHNIGVDAQGRPFYSMKLVKGRTLQAVLNLIRDGDANATKEYPRATLLTIFRKVCDAMMFAHSKGILHRDLKPENIMVGEYGEVLVMDWGLAKLLGETDAQGSGSSRVNDTGDYGMTLEGEVMGTPQYMSPEQAMGMVAELDQRSDIYSLGGILYAILTLRPPIDGTTLDEVLTKVKNGSISSMISKRGGKGAVPVGAPSAMGGEVPEALQAVTLKAMATDRKNRYASIESLAADIEAYQNGFATSAENAGALKLLALLIKRNKSISGLIAILVAGAIIFSIRIAASEQIAVQERNAARRAAAEAHTVLAEAAEKDMDGETMQQFLQKVPEDLRAQPWAYMNNRLNSHLWEANMPVDDEIRQVVSHPKKPGVFIIETRNSPGLKSFDVATATFQDFLKTDGLPVGSAISNDGSRIAAWIKKTSHWKVLLYNSADQSTVCEIPVPECKEAKAISISSDGRRLLAGYVVSKNQQCVQIWDVDSQNMLWEQKAETLAMAALSPDGKRVWLILRNSLRELDATTGNVLREKVRHTSIAAWSGAPGGDFLYAYGSWANTIYSLHFTPADEIEIRPDGKLLSLCHAANPGLLLTLSTKSDRCAVLQGWGFNGAKLLELFCLGGARGSWKLAVDQTSGDVMVAKGSRLVGWKINGPPISNKKVSSAYGALSFLGGGSKVASIRSLDESNKRGALRVFELTDLSQSTTSTNPERPFSDLAMLPVLSSSANCDLLAVAEGEDVPTSIRLLRNDGEKLIDAAKWKWTSGSKPLSPFLLSPQGHKLLIGDQILNASTGTLITALNAKRLLQPAEYSVWLDDKRLAEIRAPASDVDVEGMSDEKAAFQRALIIWNADTGEKMASVATPKGAALAASPDGRWIAEAGLDNRVRIREANNLLSTTEFRAHDDVIHGNVSILGSKACGLAWHPRKPILVTLSMDGSMKLWEMPAGKLLNEIRGLLYAKHTPSLPMALNFSQDGETVLISMKGSGVLWYAYSLIDLRSGAEK